MLTRQQLDRLALRITGEDIRLLGFWAPLPGLEEFRAEYARELGVSEAALLRCRDIVDVLDLAGNARTVRQTDAGQPYLLQAMNARQLSEQINDTLEILERLRECLEASRKQSDPFGVFMYRERQAFRRRSEADISKSGKRTREWSESSYRRAMTAGFRGDFKAWIHLLHAQTPAVALDDET